MKAGLLCCTLRRLDSHLGKKILTRVNVSELDRGCILHHSKQRDSHPGCEKPSQMWKFLSWRRSIAPVKTECFTPGVWTITSLIATMFWSFYFASATNSEFHTWGINFPTGAGELASSSLAFLICRLCYDLVIASGLVFYL